MYINIEYSIVCIKPKGLLSICGLILSKVNVKKETLNLNKKNLLY